MKKKKYLKRFFQLLALVFVVPVLIAFLAITFYKKELMDLLISYAQSSYGLTIQVEKTKISLFENWPNATVEAFQVNAASDLADKSAPAMFQAQSISFSLNLPKLLAKKFVIHSFSLKNGSISLVKSKTGATNFKLLQPADTIKHASAVEFDIHKISLKDVRFNFVNEEADKHIGILFRSNVIRVNQEDKLISAVITGNVQIEELLFKRSKGAFLKNTEATLYLNTLIYPLRKSFFVDETSFAVIDEEKYSLVSFVKLMDEKKLTLKIKTPAADFKKGLRLMNSKIKHDLAKISVTGPVAIDATIIAAIGTSQEPQLYVTFRGSDNNLMIGNTKIPYEHVTFNGHLRSIDSTRTQGDMATAVLMFKNINGRVYDFPFTADIMIKNFKDPNITINGKLVIEGENIKSKPGKDFILNGFCFADIHYKGDVSHLNNKDFLEHPQHLSLRMQFKKFSYQTAADQPVYTISGTAEGLNKDIAFKALKLETVGGEFAIDGTATDFVPYVFGLKEGFKASIQAATNEFDLTPLIAKSFQTSEKTATAKKVSKQDVKDAMYGPFSFNIQMNAKKLVIRNLVAENASVEMNYANKSINITKLMMNACNGTLSATGTLHNFSAIQAHVAIKDMQVNTMFEQFENFGQSTISSKKLQGTISLTADVKTRFNEKFQLQAPELEGEVKLKLTDGHLMNFEPLQNISNFIFRKRDFADISFSEINQTFHIKGTEMNIKNLEIASSVLTLYIDGIYNFSGQTDLNLRIPFNNLKKRDKDYIPTNLGKEGREAKALLLNAHGLPNKIKISLGAHSRDTLNTSFK